MQNDDLKFGANYVPPHEWFYSWVDFSPAKMDEDFHALKAFGLDHLRVFLRWDLFQPATGFVADSMLKKLEIMLDTAEKYGLQLIVTVFTGWMSGFWFLPAFTRNHNIITDEKMIKAEDCFLTRIAESVGNHKALAGIDLGNELNVYHRFINQFSREEGDAWLKHALGLTKELFKDKIAVLGVDHMPWFSDTQFSRSALATEGTHTSLHTWTKFTRAINYGVESAENLSLMEYNIELANAYAEDIERPVWVQEFGTVRDWMREDQFELFLRQSMMNALRSDNLWGFTFWCSHEFDVRYIDVEHFETELGLLTKDNKIKPLGEIYRSVMNDMKNGEGPEPLRTGCAIIIDESKPFVGWEYGERFAEGVSNGVHFKFVLSSKTEDREYLMSRGIDTLIY